MNQIAAPLPATQTTVLVSVIADADSGVMARLTAIMARLDILPVQIHARLRTDLAGHFGDVGDDDQLEIDLYLGSDASQRCDRLIGLLGAMVGVQRVMSSS